MQSRQHLESSPGRGHRVTIEGDYSPVSEGDLVLETGTTTERVATEGKQEADKSDVASGSHCQQPVPTLNWADVVPAGAEGHGPPVERSGVDLISGGAV